MLTTISTRNGFLTAALVAAAFSNAGWNFGLVENQPLL